MRANWERLAGRKRAAAVVFEKNGSPICWLGNQFAITRKGHGYGITRWKNVSYSSVSRRREKKGEGGR